MIPPAQSWKSTVVIFSQQLDPKGAASVKDLCEFLLDDKAGKALRSREDVIEYLQDYIGVGMVHYEFHNKWKKSPGMSGIAEHDKREMSQVVVLIQLLGEEE